MEVVLAIASVALVLVVGYYLIGCWLDFVDAYSKNHKDRWEDD